MAEREIYRVEIPIIIDDQTDKPLQQAERKISRFEKSALKTNERIRRLFGREIKLRIGAVDRVLPVVRNIQSNLRGLTSRTWNIILQAKDKASGIINNITGGVRRAVNLLTSPLTLLGVGGGIGGLTKLGIDMVVERENITTAFETLLGSAEAAEKRIEELTEFAGQTPFLRDEIYEASRILEVFTRGALSTSKGLKLVGDVAAGTGQDYKDVALWIGRLYDAMASGRPVGEMTSRLQEMGAISGQQRALLEDLAKSGKDISQTWPQAEKVFSRFEGQMERMSTGLGNLLTSVKSFFRETVLLRWGKGIEAELRPLLERFRQWRRENPEQVQAIGDKIEHIARTGMGRIVDFVKKGYEMIADIISDESLTWSQKISVALDRILTTITTWLKGPGGEAIKTAGGILGSLLAAGLEGAIPNIVPVAVTLGTAIAKGILQGFKNMLASSPLGATISGALGGAGIGSIVPGVGTAAGAIAGGIAGIGSWAVTRTLKKYQYGGILSRPHIGLVAEAGPEAIIPLSPRFRNRARSLYQRVGNWLGTPSFNSVPLLTGAGGYGGNTSISTGPITAQFNITTSSNPDDVINAIREKYEDLVDELSEAIADGLNTIYSNMPRRMSG